ncbi:MAG: hypothetical protein HXX17_08110 [Geobacteraceae bacterium]|nr:hypothetical protein [Geobacteraceae bacterium]
MADNYIQMYNKNPAQFVLPSVHKKLLPIIEAFASDVGKFADYIRALRDSCEGAAYDELHDLYRKVSLRALQVVRRQRMRKAVMVINPEVCKRLGRPTTYDEQMDIATCIGSAWEEMRTDMLNKERASLRTKRIPTEEREVILKAFWTNIEKKLDKGEVLLGEHDIDEIVERLK